MPVPSAIADLSTTPGSNSPVGADSPSVLDDHLRTVYAFIRTLSDTQVSLTGDQTIAGAKTFSTPIGLASGGTGQSTAAGFQSILPINQTRTSVASASTVNLTSSVPSNDNINITGTTTITAFTVAAGRLFFVRFNASLTLTNNANIVTQSGANIVTQAGDTCIFRATAANTVEVLSYVPAVVNQQTTRGMVRVYTANGFGSTNTVIRRFTTAATNQGSDITYADSATAGASFTINVAGVYAISYTEDVGVQSNAGVSLNSSQLTTSITSIAVADRLVSTTIQANLRASVAWTGYLAAGSVIRPHTAGAAASANDQVTFTIVRVA